MRLVHSLRAGLMLGQKPSEGTLGGKFEYSGIGLLSKESFGWSINAIRDCIFTLSTYAKSCYISSQ